MVTDFSDPLTESVVPLGNVDRPEVQIARALAEIRHSQNITQQQLAARTGIAQADISRLENGNSNPSLRTLQRLANGLGMTIELAITEG